MTETNPQKCRLGYARVSTYGQTFDAQLEQLRAEGCSRIFREKVTGLQSDRRQLLKMLETLAPGDVVTVTRIDRLAPAHLTYSPSSSRSWTPKRNSGRWSSRGLTPAPAPGGY
jgi:DNA invertase Pin-like site-specific DNA recombinase